MNRGDWQALADVRIEEAKALLGLTRLTPPRPDGAYDLAGYAVECALKAVIGKFYDRHDWPGMGFVNECHTHNLTALMKYAKLEADRAAEMTANPVFARYWLVVRNWSEQSRYRRYSLAEAADLVAAVSDPASGVLPWIKARW